MNADHFFQYFWWGLGAFLILAEFILPGLVVVFVGIGAITVAILGHYGLVEGVLPQLLAWFISSTIYCFTLRIIVIRLYPSDSMVVNVDEDAELIGKIVSVVSDIDAENAGRIAHSDTTWPAKTDASEIFKVGDKVKIIGRDNLTFKVVKP